jgi:hypothetical protein
VQSRRRSLASSRQPPRLPVAHSPSHHLTFPPPQRIVPLSTARAVPQPPPHLPIAASSPPHHRSHPHKVGPSPSGRRAGEEDERYAPSPAAAQGPCTLAAQRRVAGAHFPDRMCPWLGLLATPHGATSPLRQQRRAAHPRRRPQLGLRALLGPSHVVARGAACAGSVARSASRPWPHASPSPGCHQCTGCAGSCPRRPASRSRSWLRYAAASGPKLQHWYVHMPILERPRGRDEREPDGRQGGGGRAAGRWGGGR